MKATWKNNSVDFVKWNGDNLDEVKEFVGDKKVFLATDNSDEIYICGVGIVRKGDYICKNGYYIYSPLFVCSWKEFPRLVNEDIGSGLVI